MKLVSHIRNLYTVILKPETFECNFLSGLSLNSQPAFFVQMDCLFVESNEQTTSKMSGSPDDCPDLCVSAINSFYS